MKLPGTKFSPMDHFYKIKNFALLPFKMPTISEILLKMKRIKLPKD